MAIIFYEHTEQLIQLKIPKFNKTNVLEHKVKL